MKKKLPSILAGSAKAALIAVLLSALFLNFLTLLSIRAIKHGQLVKHGYFCAIISSGSMEPTFSVHDLLILKAGASYQVDDIVTYVSPRGSLITHRIKEIADSSYVVQGDANNIPDEEIAAQSVLGKVVFVAPGAGAIVEGVLTPKGIILLTSIFAVIWWIQSLRREQAKSGKDETSTASGDI